MPPLKVLLVEGENTAAQSIRAILHELGHSVTSVVSLGGQASKTLKKVRPDIVLMDSALLPETSGPRLAHDIRPFSGLPVILLVASRDETIPFATNVFEHCERVLKPVDPAELQTAIEAAFPRHTEGRKQGEVDSHERVEQTTDITQQRRMEEEMIRSEEVLRKLSLHLQSAREDESKRIAREIHDELGQALTALKMDLSWISQKIRDQQPNHKKVLNKISSMSKLLDKTIHTVQKISADLRPGVLDDLGLVPAVEWLVQDFEKRSGVRCSINVRCESADYGPDCSTAVFRIIQEALTNVARHSGATQVRIDLKENTENLELSIWDNGKGIRKEEIYSPESLGLIGMRERLLPLGGVLKLEGLPRKGTVLSISIPLKRAAAR